MKKICNVAAPTVITTRRTAIIKAFSIEVVAGGTLSQAMDNTLTPTLWLPDRTVTPSVLAPLFEAYDSETLAPLSSSATFKWYIQKVQTWNPSTHEGEVLETLTASDGYYLEQQNNQLTGRLIVTKNVDYQSPVVIICEVCYTDSARSAIFKEESSVMLTSENKPEDFYDVNMIATSPIRFNPFSDLTATPTTSTKTITAIVTKGKYELSPQQLANIKFFWYFDDVLASSSHLAYVSGQGTDTLVVDANYANMMNIKVRIADNQSASAPNVTGVDERILVWDTPKIEAEPYCTSGSAVKEATGEKIFHPLVKANGHDVADAKWKDYILLQWISKRTNSVIETFRGWGDTCIIPTSDLYGNDTEVKIVTYMLGPHEAITCNGQPVTCNSEVVTCRN